MSALVFSGFSVGYTSSFPMRRSRWRYGENFVGPFGRDASIVAPSGHTSFALFPKNVREACSIPFALYPNDIAFRYISRIFSFV